jgi:hypothetical protein
MSKHINHTMSRHHEAAMVEALGGRTVVGSGNQAHDKMDGKHTSFSEHYAFAWDAKATMGQSVGVSRSMWGKAVEQAYDRRPMVGLGFYDDERLTTHTHLVVVSMDDFVEVRDQAVRAKAVIDSLQNGTFAADFGPFYLADGIEHAITTALERGPR